jgi:hypothetical protein
MKFTLLAYAAAAWILAAGVSQAAETDAGHKRAHDRDAGTTDLRPATDTKAEPTSATQGNSDAKDQPKAVDTGSDEKGDHRTFDVHKSPSPRSRRLPMRRTTHGFLPARGVHCCVARQA